MVPRSNKKEKNWLQRIIGCIWEEFIYGGHLLALGPFTVAISYMYVNHLNLDWIVCIGIYLITYIIYGLDRYVDIQSDLSLARQNYYKKMHNITPWLLSIAAISLILLFAGNISMLLFAVFLLLSGYLYTKFFKGLTRYLLGFKSYYTSAVFASTVLFVAAYYHNPLTLGLFSLYLFFFARLFANTIFCDLKDTQEDSRAGFKTFAIVLSRKNLYRLFYLVDVLSTLPIIIGYIYGALPVYSLILLLAPIYRQYYLILSKKPDVDYQYMANVWADGEFLFWLILMTIGGLLWVW